ncbi:MAG: hypothetical protein ABGX49_00235, partial [Candidatus Poseidoniia archaeon]
PHVGPLGLYIERFPSDSIGTRTTEEAKKKEQKQPPLAWRAVGAISDDADPDLAVGNRLPLSR